MLSGTAVLFSCRTYQESQSSCRTVAELTWIVVLIALLWTFGRFVLAAAMEDDAISKSHDVEAKPTQRTKPIHGSWMRLHMDFTSGGLVSKTLSSRQYFRPRCCITTSTYSRRAGDIVAALLGFFVGCLGHWTWLLMLLFSLSSICCKVEVR